MQVSHLQKGLLSGRQAFLAAKAPVPCRQNARFVVRAEGEEKKEEAPKKEEKGDKKEEKKGGAVAKVDRRKDTLLFASEQSLSYLDGSLPADYGFDPLGLSDPDGAGGFITPEWLRYSEVIHSRFAMLGAAGIVGPSILAYAGLIPQTPEEVTWFKTGVIPPAGTYERGYWADPYTLFFLEVIAFQFAELRRWQDYRKPGSMSKQWFLGVESIFEGSGDPAYPGGQFFNFFGLGKKDMKELQTKEIKNGRLAMLAIFGFGAQAVITHTDPVKNLLDHLHDPFGSNLVTNLTLAFGSS
jgi:light-harvesting complex I chlorophyll a/b binding protein 3